MIPAPRPRAPAPRAPRHRGGRELARSLAPACIAACVVLALPAVGRAEPKERLLDVGVTPHLLWPTGDACAREASDVVSCGASAPFAGARLSAHLWLLDFLGLGAGVSLAKDLDGTEGVSSDGVTWDPEDQWLWRVTAEAMLDPPILPEGLWVGVDVGVAVLREVRQAPSGDQIGEFSDSRGAPLLGLALGWDLWLGDAVTLTPELRAHAIALGDPPDLGTDAAGRDYGTTTWLELGLRLAFAP